MAPISIEAGITLTLLPPIMSRDICGIINPTKPIIPENATIIPVISEDTIKHIDPIFFVEKIPKVRAVFITYHNGIKSITY